MHLYLCNSKQILVASLMKKFINNAFNPKQKQKPQIITFQETFIKPEKKKGNLKITPWKITAVRLPSPSKIR